MGKEKIIFVAVSEKSLDKRIEEKWNKIRKINEGFKQRLEIVIRKN
ncbi:MULTISPECIES: hypothetical protein [Aneurinibacillus]|jgi:hypothetical protein|uniref:Uncharacterized protein n=1 Tax=Aneurinibacillus danicus TaxID=267746 RepID=A0A511VCP2_9BACL|nr:MULTISPECIES: hypothetical protein [Aneurinibacillus]GEN36619.1 hypothetical protein ADA01nite_40790 [Aneurinibacillus danicus]